MIQRLALLAATAISSPAAAQEVVGTMTATLAGEERTFVVTQGEGDSGFRRRDGGVEVRIVARPDRAPEDTPARVLIAFTVSGMGPTAEASDASVTYVDESGQQLSTEAGSSDVSLTAFGVEENEVTVSGDFSSQLLQENAEQGRVAIAGDFQASLREAGFVGAN